MPEAMAVHVRSLRKTYGTGFLALAGVDLDVAPGEFFGLLGPNGAGKSTLINILSGVVHRSSGVAEVFGYDVERQYRQSRQLLGVVPQELAYDPSSPSASFCAGNRDTLACAAMTTGSTS